jgi:hypothetical protein
MSQKSSLPQAIQSVSTALMPDNPHFSIGPLVVELQNVPFPAVQHRGDLISHSLVDGANGISGEVRVFLGCGALGVAQKLADDRQRSAAADAHAGEGMAIIPSSELSA